jgi:hypothetical protein
MTILRMEYFNQNAILVGLNQLLGAFTTLRKAIIIFVMSVCLSVPLSVRPFGPMDQLVLPHEFS